MRGHIIIVGGGRVGEEISKILTPRKKPFLIIESDSKVVTSLKRKKYLVIEGDALNEQTLKNAGIEDASKIILTLPKTESNVLLTLTAKELNPIIEVHSRCEDPSLVSKLKRAGAKVVTVPEVVAGDKIAKDLGFKWKFFIFSLLKIYKYINTNISILKVLKIQKINGWKKGNSI